MVVWRWLDGWLRTRYLRRHRHVVRPKRILLRGGTFDGDVVVQVAVLMDMPLKNGRGEVEYYRKTWDQAKGVDGVYVYNYAARRR